MTEAMRGPGGRSTFLVRSGDYITHLSRERAEAIADAVLGDLDEESTEEARQSLIEALLSGALALVRLQPAPRVLDRPKIVDLNDLVRDDERPKEPVVRPTWCEIFVVAPDGRPYPDATVEVRFPDGDLRRERVDTNGRWRADDVPSQGTCRVRVQAKPGDPQGTARTLAGNEPVIVVGRTDTGVVTARSHVVVLEVPRPQLPATAAPWGGYLPQSVLLLPRVGEPHPWAGVVAILRHLQANLEHAVVIVGHREPEEPEDFAGLRAEALRLFLADDEGAWVELATAHGRVQDTQVFLQYLHQVRGWPTPIDDISDTDDLATAAAVEQFQKTYNLAYHRDIYEDGVIGEQTLGAVFEVAKSELVHWMQRYEVSLEALQFYSADKPAIEADPEYEGARRVGLVALPTADPYDLERTPPAAGIYEVADLSPLSLDDFTAPKYGVLQVRLIDEWGRPAANCGYDLSVGDDHRVGETDEHGMLAEAFLPVGTPVLRLHRMTPVLFHDRYQLRRDFAPIMAEGDFNRLEEYEETDDAALDDEYDKDEHDDDFDLGPVFA